MTLPIEMEESALIDGANDLQVLYHIYIPLSKAVLATVALWVMVGLWNDYTGPLLYLKDYDKFTLQRFLRQILTAGTLLDLNTDENQLVYLESVKYANIVFTALPILMVYPFLQKYFVKGVMLGAVKG